LAHVGVLGAGVPDLLPVGDEVAVVDHTASCNRSEIRARARFGEALREQKITAENAGQPAPTLLLGADRDDRRPGVRQADEKRFAAAAPGTLMLFVKDQLLHGGGALATVLRGPCDARQTGLCQALLPVPLRLQVMRVDVVADSSQWWRFGRRIRGEPLTQ